MSEQGNVRASGPVLQSVFLAVFDHSGTGGRTSEWPSTCVPIIDCFKPLCKGGEEERGGERRKDHVGERKRGGEERGSESKETENGREEEV